MEIRSQPFHTPGMCTVHYSLHLSDIWQESDEARPAAIKLLS